MWKKLAHLIELDSVYQSHEWNGKFEWKKKCRNSADGDRTWISTANLFAHTHTHTHTNGIAPRIELYNFYGVVVLLLFSFSVSFFGSAIFISRLFCSHPRMAHTYIHKRIPFHPVGIYDGVCVCVHILCDLLKLPFTYSGFCVIRKWYHLSFRRARR